MGNTFIDLFAGCGGLSLGLIRAGWNGLFAIEKSPDAFATLKHNLVDGDVVQPFNWPVELPCEAMQVGALLALHRPFLKSLAGTIDLIAGGPPCQGFSFAGKRNEGDPRNQLFEEYVDVVAVLRPKFLLLENVRGFASGFRSAGSEPGRAYADVLKERLEQLGYRFHSKMLSASQFGVPQTRARFIMIATRLDVDQGVRPFRLLAERIEEFRRGHGLPAHGDTSVRDAISDLEIAGARLVDCPETQGFKQLQYIQRRLSPFQKAMRSGLPDGFAPNSLRLPNHGSEVSARFKRILARFPKGKAVSKIHLEALGTKKHSVTPLHPEHLSKTITTLPDDLLHYSEPRILTVRENARIQTFPDWYHFRGKFTTGGSRRKDECPRYSQVGNAVPPLMAEALGRVIKELDPGNG
ncbi:DNA cytosine methyltransferase [Phyllobacterium sp. P30BS-XVII]|uniref:DNA (cytosine-5-)-methyltransferase n=1 Tax=Phyllobacterium sp. P30BS-XVII TaxID=2587046 RepID=UPI0015FB06CB|nr:DNA (cytosine-5)-methyltransferase 1 [Phyllobacterium sp. P30BS-XVII]